MDKWITINRAIGMVSVTNFVNPRTGEVLFEAGDTITKLSLPNLLAVCLSQSVWQNEYIRTEMILVSE